MHHFHSHILYMQARVLEHSTRAEACLHKHLSSLVGRKNFFSPATWQKRPVSYSTRLAFSHLNNQWDSHSSYREPVSPQGPFSSVYSTGKYGLWLSVGMNEDLQWGRYSRYIEGKGVLSSQKGPCVCVCVCEGKRGVQTGACTCVHTYIHKHSRVHEHMWILMSDRFSVRG